MGNFTFVLAADLVHHILEPKKIKKIGDARTHAFRVCSGKIFAATKEADLRPQTV